MTGQLTEGGFYLAYGFRQVRICHGKEAWWHIADTVAGVTSCALTS